MEHRQKNKMLTGPPKPSDGGPSNVNANNAAPSQMAGDNGAGYVDPPSSNRMTALHAILAKTRWNGARPRISNHHIIDNAG